MERGKNPCLLKLAVRGKKNPMRFSQNGQWKKKAVDRASTIFHTEEYITTGPILQIQRGF